MSPLTVAALLLAASAVVYGDQLERTVCTCQSIYLPVCARTTRGRAKTYSNLCQAQCASSTVLHDGKCELADCRCTRVYRPVCGDDNQDYNNLCIAECLGVTVVSQGQCPRVSHTSITKRRECTCTMEFNPVCGADGNDYGNPCLARCGGTTVAKPGPCRCTCTMNHNPVCGSDGQDYSNACLARCNGVQSTSRGRCDELRPVQLPVFPDKRGDCESRCTKEYKPVCGPQGDQYNNKCIATCEGVQENEISAPPCLAINPLFDN